MDSQIKIVCALEAAGQLCPKKRKYSVNPLNVEGRERNSFEEFFQKMRKCHSKFFEYYRMSIQSFDELLELLRDGITKQHTCQREPISAEQRLTITLRFLSTGSSFSALQKEFYVGISTISIIVRETCQVIWSNLKAFEMPEPTEEMWLQISETFYKKTNFPNCVGSIDGKHIKCKKPVVLIAIVDADLAFITVDVGAFGKDGYSNVFKECAIGKKLYSNELNLPPPRCLPNMNESEQPFVFIGDEAFKIHTNLLRPFPQRCLDARRRVFNYRLSRGRRTVECAFGVLANKWRIFHTAILAQPDVVNDIVKACCILHNFVLRRDGINFEETTSYPFDDVGNFGPAREGTGLAVRNIYADYFLGKGAVSSQNKHMF